MEVMDEAVAPVSRDFQGELELDKTLSDITRISSSSMESDSDVDALDRAESDDSDDNFGEDALPIDREGLEHELARLDDLERRLQLEKATDFVLECELLLAMRQERVTKAQAALERRHSAARKVCEYSVEKARERCTERCLELQREMNADIERELRRLQTAKDGVSVTSRRRRAVRDESRGGFSTPAKTSGNGMRRRRTIDGDDRPEDVFLASASPEERAHRVQFEEKKRLERLLGRASVFEPAVKQMTAEEIAQDLEAIRSAVLPSSESLKTKAGKKNNKKKLKEKPKRRRPMIITPRRIPHASGPNLAASATPSLNMKTAKNPRPRLHYNPRMLQEGQEVEVFKRTEPETENLNRDERVMSGVITATTATHVYVLTASGRFETLDVCECVQGSLYVRAVENSNSPRNSASQVINSSNR
ncbi:hypothetical protein P3T76_005299 [Phytophthora citrophthora]|uniref:Uncharacterized protein n=1 Tax=Phytophthora citrophthora TaxID=4793 RepID=A0AAD9GTD5_9STRA|nr:hypothetical protein P3T76_005299 [Phytophthora citrophthora]